MKILATAVALALLAGTAHAADKPNFSGNWKMNAAKSSFGPVPPPDSITRKISHSEPSISIDEEQLTAMGLQKTTRVYTTDGKEMSFEAQGAHVTSTAAWDGNTLVVTSNVPEAGLRYLDKMTLAEDGKTMTSTLRIATPQGDLDMIIVFERP
jgi:hypothetical protein